MAGWIGYDIKGMQAAWIAWGREQGYRLELENGSQSNLDSHLQLELVPNEAQFFQTLRQAMDEYRQNENVAEG
jgi:hypothetical protein